MEKLSEKSLTEKILERTFKELYEDVSYEDVTGRYNIHQAVDTVGVGFCFGTFLGFPYHLIKGRGMPIISRLHGATMKSSRWGGFCALFVICSDVIGYPVCKFRGDGILTHDHPEDIVACTASAGALLQARRGLLPAAGTALAVGGIFGSVLTLNARYCPKNSEISTYSYPHYRLPPQHTTYLQNSIRRLITNYYS